MRKTLVIMVKEPRPGRVKTRLGQDIGMVRAAWWFRHQLNRLIQRLSDPRWDLVLAVSPDNAGLISRMWPAHIPRHPQGCGDLGQRMMRIFQIMPPGPVCIIGADIPAIQPVHIAEAFGALGRNDIVFGPANDGGYWLIGQKRTSATAKNIFNDVRWSTEYALADSVANLKGHKIAFITQLNDVDTSSDLKVVSEAEN